MKRSQIKNLFGLRFVALALILLLASVSYAQTTKELYTAASALYKQNQFEQAAADYEKLVAAKQATAEVYFNLGNCYYKQNKLGKAILNYERAKALSPADEDINVNLRIANAHLIDKVQPVPQLAVVKVCGDFVSARSCNGWRTTALVFVWLAAILLSASLFVTAFKSALRGIGLVLLVASLGAAWFGHIQNCKVTDSGRAVLLTESTYAKSSPDAAGNNAFMIHEGITFELLDKVGSWTKIRLYDGKVGWIEAGNFEKI